MHDRALRRLQFALPLRLALLLVAPMAEGRRRQFVI
jgi:hypothetical protein